MFTFDQKTGTYNVEFGNVSQTSKRKKMKQLIRDEQDPIFLVSAGSSVVVFDNDAGRYTREEKGKQQMMDPVFEEKWVEPDSDDEMEQLEFEIERDMKRQAVVDLTVDDILDDVTGPEVMDEEDEIYQMQQVLEPEFLKDMKQEEEDEEEKKQDLVISRDKFVEKHNDIMAKGVVRAIRQSNTLIPKEVLEKTPEGLYDKAHMVKLSYAVSAAQNDSDLNDAETEFNEAVQSKDLVFKRSFSNREAVVIHDVRENVYTVAWHGANAEGGNAKEDWQSIKSVMGTRFDKDAQFKRADEDLNMFMRHIAEVNPEAKINLVGYSLGGAKSLHLGEKYNLEGTHINAFVSPLSDYKRSPIKNPKLMARQEMIRIVEDPFTAQSAIPPLKHPLSHNRKYTGLNPLKENKNFDDGHSLDQFTSKRPRGVGNLVEKKNVLGKSLGHAALVGGAMYGGYEGYKQGRGNSGSLSEESYRAVIGSVDSSLPIVGEGDIVTSGIIGFTESEISNTFKWVTDSIFGKKKEPEEPDVPIGFTQVSGQGFVAPDPPAASPPTRRLFGPQLFSPPARRNFGPQDSPQPFPPNPNQMQ
jgi:hypothetical protein